MTPVPSTSAQQEAISVILHKETPYTRCRSDSAHRTVGSSYRYSPVRDAEVFWSFLLHNPIPLESLSDGFTSAVFQRQCTSAPVKQNNMHARTAALINARLVWSCLSLSSNTYDCLLKKQTALRERGSSSVTDQHGEKRLGFHHSSRN